MSSIEKIFAKFRGQKRDDSPGANKARADKSGSASQISGLVESETRYGLLKLYDGTEPEYDGEGSEDGAVDIVAIHGLGGHPIRSFTERETGCCWLRDFLPLDLPRCRVFSYGYDSTASSYSSLGFYDISRSLCEVLRRQLENGHKRPIIFICHSLGGIIAKEVLVIANVQPARFERISNSVTGVVFLGTPHRGSSSATLSDVVAKVTLSVSKRFDRALLQHLKSNSEDQMRLNSDFSHIASNRLQISSFYEELVTPLVGIVVDRSTAVMGLEQEVVISLHSNHTNMTKFHSRNDSNYRIVMRTIRRMTESGFLEKTSHLALSQNSKYSLSRWEPNIVSKKGTTAMGLFEMAGSMEDPQDFSQAEIDIVAIHGLGGSPSRSWINNLANTLWLRDFLLPDFPTARVLSYGYRTEAAFRDKSLDISLLASDLIENILDARQKVKNGNHRPLILIGYSFGGLLIKKALLLLRDKSNAAVEVDLRISAGCVVFLGVPHDLDKLSLTSQWTGILQCTSRMKSIDSLDMIDIINQIRDITTEFSYLDDVYAASVAESEPVRIGRTRDRTILVPAEAACLRWQQDRDAIFVAQNRNHLELPTFIDAEDPTYVFIKKTISQTLRRLGLGFDIGERDQCLRALHRASYDSDSVFQAIADPYDGTCRWILDSAELQTWLSQISGSILLVEGSAGRGKSVLAKYLVKELSKATGSYSFNPLHLFLSIKYGRKIQVETLLASLLFQLCNKNSNLIRYAITIFRVVGEDFTSSADILWEIISLAAAESSDKDVIVVMDALDECPDAEVVLQVIGGLQKFPHVRVALTCRPSSALQMLYHRRYADIIKVSLASVSPTNDLELYVNRGLDALGKDYDLEPTLLQEMHNKILTSGNGTFLWVNLVLSKLRQGIKDGTSRQELTKIISYPRDISSMYQQTVNQVRNVSSTEEWGLLYNICSILLVALAPLTLDTLFHALTTSSSYSSAQPGQASEKYEVSKIQALIQRSQGLLQYHESTHYVHFIHLSFKDFLMSPANLQDSKHPVSSSNNEANLDMTARCITTLNQKFLILDGNYIHGTFKEYAAMHWTSHFSAIQDGIPKVLLDGAFDLFKQSSSLNTEWLDIYEKATGESLPRHQFTNPLYGAAYFGLHLVAAESLSLGADIEAHDSKRKTALHWACHKGYFNIVHMLLEYGAQINGPDSDGWTSLHFAVEAGHMEILRILCDRGADINHQAGNGQSALQIAIESQQNEIAKILLEYGADPTLGRFGGPNVLQLVQTASRFRIEDLMSSTPASKAIISRAVSDKDFDNLKLVFQYRLDLIKEQYLWITSIMDTGLFSQEEMVTLVLKSENLDWLAEEEWTIVQAKDEKRPLPHQPRCPHTLNANILPVTDNSVASRGQVDSLPVDDNISDPLSKLEKREQDVLSICGIGGVFPPLYTGTNPGFARMRLYMAEIMYGAPDEAANIYTWRSLAFNPLALQFSSKMMLKSTPDDNDNASIDSDNASINSSSTATSNETIESYNSDANFDDYELWSQSDAEKILTALRNVLSGLALLNSQGSCCDSFTLLVRSSERRRVIELKSISSNALAQLCDNLGEYCAAPQGKPSGWTQPLATNCLDVLRDLGCNSASEYLHTTLGSGKTPSPVRCLHLCALIAQAASVSLVTYTRGHSREFYTQCLTRPVDIFILSGLRADGPYFCAERVELACMGKMLDRKVWMFHQDKRDIGTFDETFFLATTMELLLDTWGGWTSLQSQGIVLHTGGGSITSSQINDKTKLTLKKGEVYCHWSADYEPLHPDQSLFLESYQLLVAGTSENPNCTLNYAICQSAITLRPMGTRPPGWKTAGRSVGFSGGQYFSINGAFAQSRDDGRNAKQLLMETYHASPDLRILNSPWGLELSLCTGVARRVLLRQLMYGPVLDYLARSLPGEWSVIKPIASQIPTMTNEEFGQLLDTVTEQEAIILKKATERLILAMEYTGVGKDGHTLTLWWPESLEAIPRCVLILKHQYSGKNPWIPMLKDSENSAVFGLATARCLQHDGIKQCRHAVPGQPWEMVENVILDTTLTPAESQAVLHYGQDARYILYQRLDILRVTSPRLQPVGAAVQAAGHDEDATVVQLHYIPGGKEVVPRLVIKALRLKTNYESVREKQALNDQGQTVLIL